MTDEEKGDASKQGRVTQAIAPIAGRTELQQTPSEGDKEHTKDRARKFFRETKRWLDIVLKDFRLKSYRARFVLEVVGLIVLGFYTYQAREANRLTRQSMAAADRPWIGVGAISIKRPLAHSVAMQAKVIFNNSGRSPALHLMLHTVLVRVTPTETIESIFKARDANCVTPEPKWGTVKGGMLYLPSETDGSFDVISDALPDNEVDFLNGVKGASIAPTPSLGLWLVGCIDYFDQFHNAHRTYVCRYLVEGKDFFVCDQGNDAD